jgi:hypothetical protein
MNVQNIVEFAQFLWGDANSVAQLCLLKVLYGLALTREERALWRRFAGKGIFARYSPREYSEAVAILGRQSGKSSRCGVTCALYEALCVPHKVPEGERLAILFFAPTIRQSTFDQVSEKLRAVPELAQFIESDNSAGGEIRLRNGIDLVGISANPRHARGRAAILCVVDEANFIRTSSDFEMNLPELLESIRPSLIVYRGKLLLLSTPSNREGVLFEAWENREANADAVMVWRAPSASMNPAIDPDLLKRERARGESYWQREWQAEFVESLNPFLPEGPLFSAVQKNSAEISLEDSDERVFGAVDTADKRDSNAMAIATVRDVGGVRKVVVLKTREWKPGLNGHNVLKILEEVGGIFRNYRVSEARGDQKNMSACESIFMRYGVGFKRVITAGAGSESAYRTFLALLNDERLVLPDDEVLLGQLRRLEEKIGDGNRFLVQGRRGAKDDVAVAAVTAVARAAENLEVYTPMTQYLPLYDPQSDDGPASGGLGHPYQPGTGGWRRLN